MKSDQRWDNATWEGNRRAQLRASLKLTPRQRFEALEDMARTSRWLAGKDRDRSRATNDSFDRLK